MMVFVNHDAAFRFFRSWLVQRYSGVSPLIPMNKGRHCLIKTADVSFYVVFKKEFFLSYSKIFKSFLDRYPNLAGYGESLNVSIVQECFENNYTLVFLYPNGSMYTISPGEIIHAHGKALECMPNGLIRSQDKTNTYKVKYSNGYEEDVNEATYSFPIKMLKRINE